MSVQSPSSERQGTDEAVVRAEALGNPLHEEHPFYLADEMIRLAASVMEKLTAGEDVDLDKLKQTSFTLIGYCQKFNTWCDTMAWGAQQAQKGQGNS